MKILVVEDNAQYAEAAREELAAAGHEVKIISEADAYWGWGRARIAVSSDGLLGEYVDTDDRDTYYLNPPRSKFDAVLLDLFMPEENLEDTFGGADPTKQQPYGLILALRAAQCGVKYVGVISDANHHKDGFSAVLDFICPPHWWSGKNQPVLRINDSIVGIARTDTHEPNRKQWLDMLNHLIAHGEKK